MSSSNGKSKKTECMIVNKMVAYKKLQKKGPPEDRKPFYIF